MSLDPTYHGTPPDVGHTPQSLIGPTLDFMTFYVDLWLATKGGKLVHEGDHFRFTRSAPNSWADSSYITLGEDAIDFDIALAAIDTKKNAARVVVKYIPPDKPAIKVPTDWMNAKASEAANNWVQVQKRHEGKFRTGIGKGTFDVEITVSLADGRILTATMDNVIEVLERVCENAALENPGEPRHYQIHRRIEIH